MYLIETRLLCGQVKNLELKTLSFYCIAPFPAHFAIKCSQLTIYCDKQPLQKRAITP
jgi:hypothetical protein